MSMASRVDNADTASMNGRQHNSRRVRAPISQTCIRIKNPEATSTSTCAPAYISPAAVTVIRFARYTCQRLYPAIILFLTVL